jgi:hypothetical protein
MVAPKHSPHGKERGSARKVPETLNHKISISINFNKIHVKIVKQYVVQNW